MLRCGTLQRWPRVRGGWPLSPPGAVESAPYPRVTAAAVNHRGRRWRASVGRSTFSERHGGPWAAMGGEWPHSLPSIASHWLTRTLDHHGSGGGVSGRLSTAPPRAGAAPGRLTTQRVRRRGRRRPPLTQDPTGGYIHMYHRGAGPRQQNGGVLLWRPACREADAPVCRDQRALRDTQPCQGRHCDCVGEEEKRTARSSRWAHGLLHFLPLYLCVYIRALVGACTRTLLSLRPFC